MGRAVRRRRAAPWRLATAAAALALLAAACGGGGGAEGDAAATPAFSGIDGRTLFGQACAACHGAALEGSERGPPLIHPLYRPGHHDDAAFLRAVRFGVISHHWTFGDMPPVEGLTGEQAAAIVAWVRERQRAAGVE